MNNFNILIFNCGSSSLNYKVFNVIPPDGIYTLAYGKAHRVGVKGIESSFIEHTYGKQSVRNDVVMTNHQMAAILIIDYLNANNITFHAIGHRFVHGGSYFQKPSLLTPQNQSFLEACLELAPIHNPNSMSVIKACQERFPNLPEYASFDTAFHAGMPEWAYTYPLPTKFVQALGLRKFGFHGLSYKYITGEIEKFTGVPLDKLKMIICHLGTGGSSIVAIRNGQTLDTSMGYSPLPGLMMSTRSGDLDPIVPIIMEDQLNLDPNEINSTLNKKSGLLGISEISSDIRDILKRIEEEGDGKARTAFEMYTYRLRKYIGAYITVLGGIDVLTFTDDIGVQNWQVRSKACCYLEWAGIQIDQKANQKAPKDQIAIISTPGSPVSVLSMPTDEEIVIGREGLQILQEVLC